MKLTAFYLAIVAISIFSCNQSSKITSAPVVNIVEEKQRIAATLDSFNVAAAKADFSKYFSYYTDDAIFTGTDATERWNKKDFMAYAKPYFDKGRAWNFSAVDRHIYFDNTGKLAWFDELLNTQMKICRGSGVLIKDGENWKIKQYILSAMIPNEQMDSVVKMKAGIESEILKKF